jgi:glycosyltransferase involved in cell wall biosynthesis
MTRKKLLFLATEDWFVRSHFLPLLRAAAEEGFDVVVAAADSGVLRDVEGIRFIPIPSTRGSLLPWQASVDVSHIKALIAREQPDIVHAIALKPIAQLVWSGASCARVFALTGRGFLAAGKAPWRALAGVMMQHTLRSALDAPNTILLVENKSDAAWGEAGRVLPMDRVVLMPGAGVDPDKFAISPEPPGDIVVGVVARLIQSKGVDLAVAAVEKLRADGRAITLRIAGERDPHNPASVSAEEIARWRATPGVELQGRVSDINAFWAGVHIACLPSRGGEGLPRSLLEAAACGRPIVTTDTPGCADFVVHGQTGLICPRDDVNALSDALRTLSADSALRARMGEAGRARVLSAYTEAHAAACAVSAWRKLVSR